MNEKRNINITIAGIPMNITVAVDDEEHYRLAAKEINQRVLEYKSHMGTIESEKFYYLAGVCLEYKLRLIRQDGLNKEMELLCEELDKVIS